MTIHESACSATLSCATRCEPITRPGSTAVRVILDDMRETLRDWQSRFGSGRGHRRAADRGPGPDGLSRDGQAVGAAQSRDHRHRQRGLRGLGRLLLLPEPSGQSLPSLPDPGALSETSRASGARSSSRAIGPSCCSTRSTISMACSRWIGRRGSIPSVSARSGIASTGRTVGTERRSPAARATPPRSRSRCSRLEATASRRQP